MTSSHTDLLRRLCLTIVLGVLISACAGRASSPILALSTDSPIPSRTPFQPLLATQTSQNPPTPSTGLATASNTPELIASTNQGETIWLAPYLPEALQTSLVLPAGYSLVNAPEEAQIRLEVGDNKPISRWVYALVAPYPTIPDGVSIQDIKKTWQGKSRGPFSNQPILMDEKTLGVFSAWWGSPASGAVQTVPADKLVNYAWEQRPSWGIVPFEAIEPRWKVLEVDGGSPLRKDFDASTYPLIVPFSLSGESGKIEALRSAGTTEGKPTLGLPALNRQPDRLTTVDLTGVTALVRATAYTMHQKGITYPARDIGALLREADITHISNEIPFTPDCPPPIPDQQGLVFCSDPSYIALMEEVGTDIVELTGDHFGDWGPEAMLYTLKMYNDRGWTYYGGGANLKDARQARLIEHNGNRLAFIGCNAKGGGYATASATQPGAVACDYDWMHREIARLNQAGYQVITTFQHFEYYTYAPQPDQVRDFQGMAEAGATIVSGSQAHQPQAIEFDKGAFIHYGLGNLFFDQWHYCTDYACDYGFIDRHVFYNGKYLGNELITIIFEDYARPRLMNPEERAQLLQKVFSASGW